MDFPIRLPAMARSLHHTIVPQPHPNLPRIKIPVLYISQPSEDGAKGLRLLEILLEYTKSNSALSMTWHRKRVRAVGMLYDYVCQRASYFEDLAKNSPFNIYRLFLGEFASHLRWGTMTNSPEGIVDPTGLYWQPRKPDEVIAIASALNDVIEWCHEHRSGDSLLSESDLWPGKQGPLSSGVDGLRVLYAAHYAHNTSLLAHIKRQKRVYHAPSARVVKRDPRSFDGEDVKRFPAKFLNPLLKDGFRKNEAASDPLARADATGRLAALILAGGGGRSCEPLHIWVNDVTVVDGDPVIFLRHPQLSTVETIEGTKKREEYLEQYCGDMAPRNRISGKFHAGWKGIKCNKEYWAPIYWGPFPGIKELFLECFLEYVRDIRPRLMRERSARGLPDHPFLLVSSGSAWHDDDETSTGDPYTLVALKRSWIRAMRRLQKQFPEADLRVRKNLGTSLHGLRHLYGASLAQIGMSEEMIQECMHHIHPSSQRVYKKPLAPEIHNVLSAAQELSTGISLQR
jgi:integrase